MKNPKPKQFQVFLNNILNNTAYRLTVTNVCFPNNFQRYIVKNILAKNSLKNKSAKLHLER